MKKTPAILAGLIIVLFATLPPIEWSIPVPSREWPWMITLAGFAGVYLCFLQVNWIVKAFAVAAFLNCFFSSAPYISFTAYPSLIAGCYFYYLCSIIDNWRIPFQMIQALIFLNIFLMLMQILGRDVLLNFGLDQKTCFMVTGQHMQAASFAVALSAVAMSYSVVNWGFALVASFFCGSAGGFLAATTGLILYLKLTWHHRFVVGITIAVVVIFLGWILGSGKLRQNISQDSGRTMIWTRTVKLIKQHPWTGWGISSYQYLFAPLSAIPHKQSPTPWKSPHNDLLGIGFEMGLPTMFFLIGLIFYTAFRLWQIKAWACLSGLVMIAVNMQTGFPLRMLPCAPLLIFFMAFIERTLNGKTLERVAASNCEPCAL